MLSVVTPIKQPGSRGRKDVLAGEIWHAPDPDRSAGAWNLALILFVALPVLPGIARLSAFPAFDELLSSVSLSGFSEAMEAQLAYILTVPLGAVVVVVFRLTLGLRVLGPFRPILIAIALQMTGLVAGLVMLLLVMLLIALVWPPLRAQGLPYFARMAVGVSLVVGVILLGAGLQIESLTRSAYFSIVVLCLAVESFGHTFHREGVRSAVWRTLTTIAAAVVISAIASVPVMLRTLTVFPG